MKELIISEFLRMRSRKKNKICLLILIIAFLFTIFWDSSAFLGQGIGFYTPDISCKLNSLNYPLFCMKNVIFILFIVVLPILFIDSLSGEYESGAYRLILVKPYTRMEFWFSKLIVQSLFTLMIFIIFFILSIIAGYALFPKVSSTTFYNSSINYTVVSAFLYNLKAVLLMCLVSNAILAISALISSVIPKAVISFIILLSILIGSLYVGHGFDALLMPLEAIVKLLSSGERMKFYVPVISCIVIGLTLSTVIFSKKDLNL